MTWEITHKTVTFREKLTALCTLEAYFDTMKKNVSTG